MDEKTTKKNPGIAELLEKLKTRTPTLLIVAGSSGVGRTFPVGTEPTVIGRSVDASISLDDEGASRQHAKVVREGDTVMLSDLGSRNGTYCNGDLLREPRALKEGDTLIIGQTILRFTFQDRLDSALQESLYGSATKDALTGAFNRKTFEELLGKEFAYCSRHRLPMSVLMVDVDHFKKVNDTWGHPVGDEVLVRIAQTLRTTLRTEDLFARYGGEEFVVLIRQSERESAVLLAERLRAAVEAQEFTARGERFRVTISVGVATLREHRFADATALVGAADERLYAAKAGGRNRVESVR